MTTIRSLIPSAVIVLFCVFVLPTVSQSQSQSSDAHLSGTLTDSSGASLSGVRITAQRANSGSSVPFSTTSSSDGSYTLSVPGGVYRVQFAMQPFASRDLTVDLSQGMSQTLNLRMELQSLSDKVLVTAQSQPIPDGQSTAPNSITGREEIEQRQSVFLPELLTFAPGVTFARNGTNGGNASLFLDGGNSGFTKVLVDGTAINPAGGAVDFSVLTTDNIEKVEIVRGAESAIYGTDALSGVVQLFTQRGSTAIPAFSIFSEGGGYSTGRGGVQASGLLGRFDYSGSASLYQTAGQYPNSDYINRAYTGNFGYAFSDSDQLRLSIRDNSGSAGIPGEIGFEPPSLYQRYNQDVFSANLRWDFATGTHWQNQLMGAESYTTQHSFNPQRSYYATDPNAYCPQSSPTAVATPEFCDYVYDDTYQYNRASFNAQTTYTLRDLRATAGYQYEVENGSLSYLEQPHVRRNNQGGYLDFRYLPLPKLSLDFGVRAEANANFGTRVVPRVGVSYVLHTNQGLFGDTRLQAFYGEGIKEPRFDQTYGTDPCDPGNPNLKPESSKNWSGGFDQKLASNRIKLSANYFYYRFYNVISFGEAPSTPACPYLYTYFNTDLAFSRGTNVSAEARATNWLLISGNYMYDDTHVLKSPNASDPAEIPGNRLLRRPLNSGSITFTAVYKRFNAVFAGYFAGARTDSDFLGLGYTRNPGYARFDFSTTYNFYRGLNVYARLTNLFDKQYQEVLGYPALGRAAIIGLRYQSVGRN
ncbi:MAG TPA: TonB-dependent receptor [Candidatus Acidoferrum sp.]|nr:TonB-dependent receptor [Candidatus Acidoferrum sp.]